MPINSIRISPIIQRNKKPLLTALFLVCLAALFAGMIGAKAVAESRILGGPESDGGFDSGEVAIALAALTAPPRITYQTHSAGTGRILAATTFQGEPAATFEDISRPRGIFAGRGGIIAYAVKKGDTLSGIAAEYGVSIQTLTGANPDVRARALKIGQTISILPTTGTLYEVRGGETLESIAELFDVGTQHIMEYNPSVRLGVLEPGSTLVIPGDRIRTLGRGQSGLPSVGNYFIMPTEGNNWGQLHSKNAVDIANSCGTPIVAAAEGLVVESANDGWNNGYGTYVLIEHPNETVTRYTHLSAVSVGIGDLVLQGERIGSMGNTGQVQGETGCHLHFEVEGAKNPFIK